MLETVINKWGGYEVTAMDVYTDMFRLRQGYIQKKNEKPGQFKANPIGYWKNDKDEHGHFRIFFDDTFEETLKELQKADFAILNGVTYFGRRRLSEHASKLYALIFDLDGVAEDNLNNFFSGAFRVDAYPVPNYVILSGHGVHLYYIMEKPIALFPNLRFQLKEMKYALTERMWNAYTSREESIQKQGIFQGFRVIGGKTKQDAPESSVRAFKFEQPHWTISRLKKYVPTELRKQIDESKLFKESRMSLEEAKEKYPRWYERVVVRGDHHPTKWDISGKVHGDNPYALYDWWRRRIQDGALYHHRYFCVMMLVIYGVKDDVPYEKVKQDAYDLIPFLNGVKPDDPFTRADVDSALECYDDRYCTFPIKEIAALSAIPIEKNKRNGRKQEVHMATMRAIQDIIDPQGDWRNKEGRPIGHGTAAGNVSAWREAHPEGRKADCVRETGLSKKTVYKWWNGEEMGKKISAKQRENYRKKLEEMAGKVKEQSKRYNYAADSEDEKKYPVYIDGNPEPITYWTKAEMQEQNVKSGKWHKELPEFYVVEGDPNAMAKMMQWAAQGIRTVDILSRDEYDYLMSKKLVEEVLLQKDSGTDKSE
jgi:hypothetical protein